MGCWERDIGVNLSLGDGLAGSRRALLGVNTALALQVGKNGELVYIDDMIVVSWRDLCRAARAQEKQAAHIIWSSRREVHIKYCTGLGLIFALWLLRFQLSQI